MTTLIEQKRLALALVAGAAALGGIAIVVDGLYGQVQEPNDFTVRVRGQDVDLPYPLTAGEWQVDVAHDYEGAIIVSRQAEGRSCYAWWTAPAGVSRMTVGPSNLDDICNGRALVRAGDDRLVRFTKLSNSGAPPSSGTYSDCIPQDVAFIFDWYEVKVCYETSDGRIGSGRPKSIGSRESGLIWFFSQDNIELLVKVLNGCAINGHRWIYVAPATDVAFNIVVEAQLTGEEWVLRNPQGAQTVAGDIQALQCVTAASSARTETVIRRRSPDRQ